MVISVTGLRSLANSESPNISYVSPLDTFTCGSITSVISSVFVCKVVDGSPCYWIICVFGIVSQGYMIPGWGGRLSSLAFFVRQVLEVAREVYSCVVEAGVVRVTIY